MNPTSAQGPERVGLYIDAFNVYYGARAVCGRHRPGWRWLDLPALVADLMTLPRRWPSSHLARIVYCTALRDVEGNPTSLADQKAYLAALQVAYPGLIVELGLYVAREKTGDVLSAPGASGRRHRVVVPSPTGLPTWLPGRVVAGPSGADALRVSVSTFEEKGSDVNVAAHLLLDVLQDHVDAAVVVSNDSDLRLPIQVARSRVPVGTVNPGRGYTSSALRGKPEDGVGGHWWARLEEADYLGRQLVDPMGLHAKPHGW